jgi:hypothetical protein
MINKIQSNILHYSILQGFVVILSMRLHVEKGFM